MSYQDLSNTTSRITFFLFAIFIVLSPSFKIIPANIIATSFHDNQRLVELALLILVLLHHSLSTRHGLSASKSLHLATYTLITLAITSSILALHPRHALLELSLFVGLYYFALMVGDAYQKNSIALIKRLIYILWASILLCMVSFYTGYITATIFSTPVTWPNPLTGFSNIRSFNQYQLWGLGLITLPLLVFDFTKTKTRYFLHAGLILWSILLFFSASRGALLAWSMGIVITAIVYKKIAWPFICLQLGYIGTGFISHFILFQLIPSLRGVAVVTGSVFRDTTNDRIELWSNALDLIQAHPIFGIGPMHFAWYSQTSAHPHNSVLQIITEWGLPGAALIFTTAGYALWCWLKRFNHERLQAYTPLNQHLVVVIFFTLVANACYSLVDGVIVMPISQVMMSATIGIAIGFYSNNRLLETTKTNWTSQIFAALALVTLILAAQPEIKQATFDSEKHFSMSYSATGPRIWTEGKKPTHP